MQDRLCTYGQRVIGTLIIITLIVNWKMFSIIGSVGLTLTGNLLLLAWIVLLFVSATGLLLRRTWGLFLFYPAVLLSTVGFSISMIPFVPKLFPPEMRPWVMTGINSVLILIIIWIHWAKSKGSTNKIT